MHGCNMENFPAGSTSEQLSSPYLTLDFFLRNLGCNISRTTVPDDTHCSNQQAGTGPSRRHIQGSKIAKRLPSVKYSFTVLEN